MYDPFMGGGTTIVEASALGRRAVGTDINSLAVFLTEVKTTVYTPADRAIIPRRATKTRLTWLDSDRIDASYAEENSKGRRITGPKVL